MVTQPSTLFPLTNLSPIRRLGPLVPRLPCPLAFLALHPFPSPSLSAMQPAEQTKEPLSETLKKAGKKALGGGVAGAAAMVAQVGALM